MSKSKEKKGNREGKQNQTERKLSIANAGSFLLKAINKGFHRPLLPTSIGTTAWYLHRAPPGGLSPNRHAQDETPDFPIRQWGIHHLACTWRAATQLFSTRLTPQRLGNKHQLSTNEGRQTKIAPSTCQNVMNKAPDRHGHMHPASTIDGLKDSSRDALHDS